MAHSLDRDSLVAGGARRDGYAGAGDHYIAGGGRAAGYDGDG